MTKNYVIGLDIGTTSAKAVLFTIEGKVITESEHSYPVHHPHPSWAEQEPLQIEQAAIHSMQNIVEKAGVSLTEISAVGLSAAMHSLVCINHAGEPLSPLLTWADGRSVGQAERIKKSEEKKLYLQTGTPLHPMSPLFKLLWMKETNYQPYVQADYFLSIKEFLIYRWFGQKVVDYSIAAATGMFNMYSHCWEKDALRLTGIDEGQLFTPVPPTKILQGMKPETAKQMNVSTQIPFVLGASDGPLANLGIGAIQSGHTAITIGTSGAIRQMSSSPQVDNKEEIFCYAFTGDLWIMGGPTNNGAVVLQWMKEVLGEHEQYLSTQNGTNSYDLLTSLADEAAPGANGLLFLPYLNGERAPFWDANARGCYIGLTQAHQKRELIRAGLEGVVLGLYHIGQTLERLAGKPTRLFASGGFARSHLWVQIMADVFGQELHIPQSHQSSAWGAAWLALYALEQVDSLASIIHHIPMQASFQPNQNHHHRYQQLYRIYKELYTALRPSFQQLAQFQEGV